MKLIIENWKRFLKEGFPGEDRWQQGRDSDYSLGKNQQGEPTYGKLFLILDNEEDLKIKYPSVGRSNHGLVSHAIKHSIELGVDLNSAFIKFKSYVNQKLQSGETLYIKTEKGDFKINKEIFKKASELQGLRKDQRNEKRRIRIELQKMTNLFRMNPEKIGAIYKDVLIPRLNKLKKSYMLSSYDFYHDKGGYNSLQALPFFDPQIISDYSNKVNEIIENNLNKFVKSQVKPGLEVLIVDGFVIIKQDGKIATAMKPKRPKSLSNYLSEGVEYV